METIIGTIIGGLIAGVAMVLNSYFSAKLSREKEDNAIRRNQYEKYLSELESLYENCLHLFDKLIRGKGSASENELEKFYRLEIKISLKSNKTILSKFQELKSSIADMAASLSPLPEEFIPKFEDDSHRMQRMQRRKEAQEKRNDEAKKYQGKLYSLHKALSGFMKNHLAEKKESLEFEKS